MAKSKRGGARPGAGAKPIKDKKKPLTIYVRGSEIKKAGGKKQAKIKAVAALVA